MIPFKKSISKKQLSLLITDFVILAVVPFMSVYVYFIINFDFDFRVSFFTFDKVAFFLHIFTFMLVFYVMDLYDFKKNFGKKREIFNILLTLAIGCILSVFFSYLIGKPPLGRGIFLIYMTIISLLILSYRVLYSKLAAVHIYNKKALIIGAGKGGRDIASLLKVNPQLDIDVICVLEIDKEKEGQDIEGAPVVCQSGSLIDSVLLYKPNLLILAMRSSRYEKMVKDLIWCSQQGIEIMDLACIYEKVIGMVPLKYVTDRWLLFSYLNQPKFYFKKIKRILDLFFASLILVLAAPAMLLIAFCIKLNSEGPVLYRQRRVGKDGQEFELFKFRSMVEDAEKETGPVWAKDKDTRITRAGRILRLLRLDELPQFINVIKGEMSLIGPRPERPEFVDHFIGKNGNNDKVIPFYNERLSVKPGITGWAQVMYQYASSYEQSLGKLEYDLFYIKNMSFFLDMAILLKTMRVVLFGNGANYILDHQFHIPRIGHRKGAEDAKRRRGGGLRN